MTNKDKPGLPPVLHAFMLLQLTAKGAREIEVRSRKDEKAEAAAEMAVTPKDPSRN